MSDIRHTAPRIVLAGHGSRSQRGYDEFESFVKLFNECYPEANFRHGYLEFNQPTIEDAVTEMTKREGGPIVVVPAILAAATHVKNDLPVLLKELREKFPNEDIRFASVLDLHAKLLQLCSERIAAAEASSPRDLKRSDTCLVVVGRGTSDPDANADIAKLTRILHEGLKFGASYVCYAGTTFPLVADGLKQAAQLGFKRLLVLPYFLFDGILVQRIYAAADTLQTRLGDGIEILKAQYLGIERATAEVYMQRVEEALHGKAVMNCDLCKYRVAIPGYEREIGRSAMPHRLKPPIQSYSMHPIEERSFEIIENSFDWSTTAPDVKPLAQRLVHTTGDFSVIDDLFVSRGAVQIGIDALLRCRRIVTDVTMVQSGLRRQLLADLDIETWCGVHQRETAEMSMQKGLTRSAAGIRRAWMQFGNDVVVAIGDAPTAVAEVVRLVKEENWRPQLVIGLPVGFVGTVECKEALKSCLQIPRITNTGNKGGSNWAASVVNALLIAANDKVALNVQ